MAPINESVRQDAPMRLPATRCPRRLQPNSRRIPVLQKDSSMKTSREVKIDVSQAQYERR